MKGWLVTIPDGSIQPIIRLKDKKKEKKKKKKNCIFTYKLTLKYIKFKIYEKKLSQKDGRLLIYCHFSC